MRVLLLMLALLASPAHAQDACYDVWFTRNLHFDRAGYCFDSPLGQAIFDNSDCTGTSITLTPQAKQQVDEIKQLEAMHGCQVDTNRTSLEISDIATRRQLRDLPIRDEFESGCLGWQGRPVSLHAGTGPDTPEIGRIEPGDYVLFSFLPVGDWSYVTVHTHDFSALKSGGWAPSSTFQEDNCTDWAG